MYEYMKNRSLYDHLHVKDEGSSMLNSWKMRIKISLDAKNNVHTTNGKDMKINNEWTPMKAQDDIGA